MLIHCVSGRMLFSVLAQIFLPSLDVKQECTSSSQVDLIAKQHQLLSIPMMAEVLSWRARVAAEPVAAPLVHILDRCTERLLALFERYVHDMVRRTSCVFLLPCVCVARCLDAPLLSIRGFVSIWAK